MTHQTYQIEWIIDIDAESPEDAARQALAIQRDHNSTAIFFSCFDEQGEKHDVDLLEIDQKLATGRLFHAGS